MLQLKRAMPKDGIINRISCSNSSIFALYVVTFNTRDRVDDTSNIFSWVYFSFIFQIYFPHGSDKWLLIEYVFKVDNDDEECYGLVLLFFNYY